MERRLILPDGPIRRLSLALAVCIMLKLLVFLLLMLCPSLMNFMQFLSFVRRKNSESTSEDPTGVTAVAIVCAFDVSFGGAFVQSALGSVHQRLLTSTLIWADRSSTMHSIPTMVRHSLRSIRHCSIVITQGCST